MPSMKLMSVLKNSRGENSIYTQVNIQWEQYRANERLALREY